MKNFYKNLCTVAAFLLAGNLLNAQSKLFIGPGIGFDYGGVGGKVEFIPVKHLGIFGGAGYTLLSVGTNAGVTWKILPDSKVSPNPMIFYGYNGVFVGTDDYSKFYNNTSYGLTVGFNLDISLRKGKLTAGLFYPFRSKVFMNNYDNAKADSNLSTISDLMPLAFSVGYIFRIY